ncbi:NAD(P)-dependent oxidoreductase [Amphritea sp.]|uniref:NAD(P)-dependent oxidoreductase n=1 Tax=Amphritea sp. TaxID=1872502 RepID=UPI003A92E335
MQKITFLDKEAVADTVSLKSPSFEHYWDEYSYTEPEKLVERMQGSTVAITCGAPLRATELAQLPDLKLISVAMTGTDHVDLEYCKANGIAVCNVPAYSPQTVAEHALGLLLALRRQIGSYNDLLKTDQWYGDDWQTNVFLNYPIRDLQGSRLGIVGAGEIGRAMGQIVSGLGMEVVYYNPGLTNTDINLVSFDELLETSDAISLHCPLIDSTRDMFRKDELIRMKPGAVIINAARGGLINEKDIVEVVKSGLIAGIALDVTENEPLTADEPLLELLGHPSFLMTPHVAWSSQQAMQGLMDRAIDNINNFFDKTPTNLV